MPGASGKQPIAHLGLYESPMTAKLLCAAYDRLIRISQRGHARGSSTTGEFQTI
ncbi:hypothetical protein PTT_11883 [Pyrenophora teres f. teres 0-1]|uniref:Uncharacterized protein n=1 Tax=Pyrenophora teres f. teres (strain 0-1) TaxID=861557 RepID=E3RSJ4_PYRTT|nr:hypothetical protein PTT_11883 [Pyrenophora teres f. teres 0-1]